MMKIKASEAIKKTEKYHGAAILLQKVYSYLDTPDNMDTLFKLAENCNIDSGYVLKEALNSAISACWESKKRYEEALEQEIEA